ncbi:MAG: polyprenol phosphomannose-dependent alpha 1,6 mannosyltransferase MptB [Solirubrobacteraceae bacterium]
MNRALSRVGWGWPCLGLAGSVIITLSASDVLDRDPLRWWFHPDLPGGPAGARAALYMGIAAMCVAWLGLGWRLSRQDHAITVQGLMLIGALWCLPLAVGPAIFSRDVYSYFAQGTIVHLGIDPYRHGPIVLAAHGRSHILSAVSPFWRRTTAPYGPAFLAIAGVIAAVAGQHLIAAVLALRAVEILGLVLVASYVPRLARLLGADPARAVWLAVLSPLVMLQLVAAAHNDALMVGLLLAGVTIALERSPLLGIALCALAATIKLPAGLAVVLIALAWARVDRGRALRILARSAAAAVVVVAGVSLISGLGFGWISGSALSTPARVRLSITPATATGHTLALILRAFGSHVMFKPLEHTLQSIALVLTGAVAVVVAIRTRWDNLILCLGALLLVSVFGGPAAWPWYATWGLTVLGAHELVQRAPLAPLAVVVAAFLVKANGQLVLSLGFSPVTLALYVVTGGVIWWRHQPGSRQTSRASPGSLGAGGGAVKSKSA